MIDRTIYLIAGGTAKEIIETHLADFDEMIRQFNELKEEVGADEVCYYQSTGSFAGFKFNDKPGKDSHFRKALRYDPKKHIWVINRRFKEGRELQKRINSLQSANPQKTSNKFVLQGESWVIGDMKMHIPGFWKQGEHWFFSHHKDAKIKELVDGLMPLKTSEYYHLIGD